MIACENCKHVITEDNSGFNLYKCALHKIYKNQKDACGKWEENIKFKQKELAETTEQL